MAESSSAYFEAYRYVLQGLQEMDPFNIPFAQYLIDAKKVVAPPKYIEEAREINFTSIFEHLPRRVWHPTRDVWPQIDTTMDNSQLEAIKLALTKEISLIQGKEAVFCLFSDFERASWYWKDLCGTLYSQTASFQFW